MTCTQRQTTDGRVRLNHTTYENHVPDPLVATDASHLRPDGAVGGVHMAVFVPEKGQLAAGRTWLDRIEDVIVAAATDPAYEAENMAAPAPRETPTRRN